MINKRFLGKGGIVDYQTSNTAYDKLAFIADNYPDMVKMYDTIMAHLKLPSNEGGSGCNYLKHTYSGVPVIVKLGDVTSYGYDTSKPDDMEIIRNSLHLNRDGFVITKPMYAEEYKCTVNQLATARGKYLLNLFTENEYSSFLDKYDDISNGVLLCIYGFSTQVSRIENGVVYNTENNPIEHTHCVITEISSGNIDSIANAVGRSLPDTVKCLVFAKTYIGSTDNDYIVGYSDTLYSDYNSTADLSSEIISKEITLNNVFIFPYDNKLTGGSGYYSNGIRLLSKDRTKLEKVYISRYFNLLSTVSNNNLSCRNLLGYKDGLMHTVQGAGYKCNITDNYCTDVVMEYS